MKRTVHSAWMVARLYHADPNKLPPPDELCGDRKAFRVMTDEELVRSAQASP